MTTESTFILLFVVATAVAIVGRRWHLPYTVGLVLAGFVLGFVHVLPAPGLTKSLLFAVFLPGLLFEAAFHLDYADFSRNRMAIVSLAVPGVIGAMVATAAILAPVARTLDIAPDFDWRYALVFGALIAATDPIAVVALFRTLRVPKRLSVLVEGESLFNDGTGIVFFTLSLAIVGGQNVSVGGLSLRFIEIVSLGGLMGVAVGLAVSQVIRHVDEPVIEITLTMIGAYGAFVLAEHFHFSGVIATVAAGMLCGNYGARTGMSPSTRIAVETFWEYVAFALNSIVFLLIGFELNIRSLLSYWPMILIAYVAVMAARAAVIFGMTAVLGRTRERFPISWATVLTWGGLRGALPMVLALSLPRDFAHRELIVNMTFGVVAISILVHGLSMSSLLKGLRIVTKAQKRLEYESARGRYRTAKAALSALDDIGKAGLGATEMVDVVRREYESQLHETEDEIHHVHLKREEIRQDELQWIRRRLVLVEKEELIEAFREGAVGRDVYEELLADCDARLLELDRNEYEPREAAGESDAQTGPES